jgi:hypothetical protein
VATTGRARADSWSSMATKSAVTYSGPRSFRVKSLDALGELLDRSIQSIDSAIRRLSAGGPRRWVFTEALRGNGNLAPNVAVTCDTQSAPTIVLTLTPPDPLDFGLECGVLRLFAAGTITLFPVDGAKLDGATTSQAIPATAGFYVLVIGPSGYWLRR